MGVYRFVYDGTVFRSSTPGVADISTVAEPPQPTVRLPGPPASHTATAGVERATTTWAAPVDDGGASIDAYILWAFKSDGTQLGQQTSVSPTTLNGSWSPLLANQAVYFEVAARNSKGVGERLRSNTVIPQPQPATPPPDDWFGWNPSSTTIPEEWDPSEFRPFWNNVGLWDTSLRAQSGSFARNSSAPWQVVSSFSTSSNNQVVDFLWCTGNVTVNHTGVRFKRCFVGGSISGQSAKWIHCDLGSRDGASGDYEQNLMTGGGQDLYRCNIYGYVDIYKHPSRNITMQNCFVHDLRLSTWSAQNTYHHPDIFQPNTNGVTCNVFGNSLMAWGILNYQGTRQSCTRKSGPHWTDNNGTAVGVTGSDGDGGLSAGRTNAGWMMFNNTNILVRRNLIHFATYSYGNFGSNWSGRAEAVDNLVNPNTCEGSRHWAGRRERYAVYSNNRHLLTGAVLS